MIVGRVVEIWRHAVKSMGGERIYACEVGAAGVPGDRCYAVRDEQAAETRNARNFPALLGCSARYPSEPRPGEIPPAEITFPDGTKLRSDDAAVSARLSALVGRPVALCGLRPAGDLAHYRRGKPDGDDPRAYLRKLLGRLEDEPLPQLAGFPRELLEYASPPGTYFDAFPLHLVTTASLAELRRLHPATDADVRRFRPNLLVETAASGLVEQGWCGRTLRIGGAQIGVDLPAFRCAIPAHPQPGLSRDPALLRTIVRQLDQNLGVYASVRSPGRVAVGDPVEL